MRDVSSAAPKAPNRGDHGREESPYSDFPSEGGSKSRKSCDAIYEIVSLTA